MIDTILLISAIPFMLIAAFQVVVMVLAGIATLFDMVPTTDVEPTEEPKKFKQSHPDSYYSI